MVIRTFWGDQSLYSSVIFTTGAGPPLSCRNGGGYSNLFFDMANATATRWVDSSAMALSLGVSVITLLRYRKITDERRFLIEGTHFRRMTPAPNSPWVWDVEKTQRAFAVASRTPKRAKA